MLHEDIVERYIAGAASRHFELRRNRRAQIDSAQSINSLQSEIQTACREMMGPAPERAELNVKSVGRIERDGYTVEILTYNAIPGVINTANLYRPLDADNNSPGVVCVPGHWTEGKAHADFQRLGQLLARRGIYALLIDLPGTGERLEFYDTTLRRSWLGKNVLNEHAYLGNMLNWSGNHLANWMMQDICAGFDVLIKHAGAGASHLGVIGCNAGAALARLSCCLDARVTAAAMIAENTAPESLGGEDPEHTLFGSIERGIAIHDLLIPYAPKSLLLGFCSADKPHENVERIGTELRRIYGLLGSPQKVETYIADCPHGVTRDLRAHTVQFFARAFGLRDEHVREPETPPENAVSLSATETGQVSNSLNARSIYGFHKALSAALPPALPVPKDANAARRAQDEIRERFLPLLRLPEPHGDVESQVESRSSNWGFQVEKGRLILEGGLYIPYNFYTSPEKKPAPTVLALHERGIAGISNLNNWMTGFAEAGVHVLAIDVCGVGETRLEAPREDSEPYDALLCGAESLWAHRALNVGLNLFGLRVYCVLRTLQFMRSRWEMQKGDLSIAGVGRGGLWGLYAAALDRDVSRLALIRTLASYKLLIEHRRQNHHFSLMLPGALKHFDLPHVAACVAPRPLTLINAVNQRKDRCETIQVKRDYALTSEIYKLLGAANSFKVETADSAPETLAAVQAAIGAEGTRGEY